MLKVFRVVFRAVGYGRAIHTREDAETRMQRGGCDFQNKAVSGADEHDNMHR